MERQDRLDHPAQLKSETRQQCGYDYQHGRCPRCGVEINLNDYGKIACTCGQVVEFVKE